VLLCVISGLHLRYRDSPVSSRSEVNVYASERSGGTGSGQRAAGSGQRAAGSGQRAAGSGQRASYLYAFLHWPSDKCYK
jgi:hypothetical protein